MTDHNYYFNALKLVADGQQPVIPDHNRPETGFYRGRTKDKELVGYAFWYEDGDHGGPVLKAERNGKPLQELRALETWPYVGRNPIDQEWYFNFVKTGKWPDVSDVAQQAKADAKNADVDPASIEGLTMMLGRLETEGRELAAKGTPTEKPTADLLANIKNAAGNLEKALEAGCRVLTAPLSAQVLGIMAKWSPLQQRAATLKTDMQKIVTLYINAENKRRKDVADEAEAQRQRVVALARQQNMPIDEALDKPIAAPKPVTVGSTGRKMAARGVWSATIADRAAFLKHCENMPAIQDALEKIAGSYARHERPEIPGLAYSEDKKGV